MMEAGSTESVAIGNGFFFFYLVVTSKLVAMFSRFLTADVLLRFRYLSANSLLFLCKIMET